jgi:GGDEF domain-containing protein
LFLDVESKTLLWYWKHAFTKAVAARELSHRLWRIPGDEAFLAGLFQDLGILLLFQQLGQPYARFLDRTVRHHLDLCAIEHRAMGFPHTELSARLLRQWNLPESLCEAVAWRPSRDQDGPALTQILRLSELVARLFADGETTVLSELLETARNYCHHFDQQLEPLVLEIELKVNELADVFSLALPDGLEYRDVLAEAHRQMAHLATQAAEDLVRCRLPDQVDIDEDWILSELDTLSDALSDACAGPVDCEPRTISADVEQRAGTCARRVASPSLLPAPCSLLPATRPVVAAPNLLDRLTGAAATCRPARRPLSLLLVKLSASETISDEGSQQDLDTAHHVLTQVCARLDYPGTISLPHTESGFALILPDAERQQAVELGNDLIRAARKLAATAGVERKDWLKLDVGVASIAQLPKNFPPRDLLAGADRCLYASHASGGGVVKSIEIY